MKITADNYSTTPISSCAKILPFVRKTNPRDTKKHRLLSELAEIFDISVECLKEARNSSVVKI